MFHVFKSQCSPLSVCHLFTPLPTSDIGHIVIKTRLMNIFNNYKLPCLLCLPVCFSVITPIPIDVCLSSFVSSLNNLGPVFFFFSLAGTSHKHEDEKRKRWPCARSATLCRCQLWDKSSEFTFTWPFWWLRPGTFRTDAGEQNSKGCLLCVFVYVKMTFEL